MDIVERELKMLTTDTGACPFEIWFAGLRDIRGVVIIRTRLNRIRLGNFGDSRSLSDGVSELKIDFGPGYRVYYALHGSAVVVLLHGGDKDGQDKDIARAKELWKTYKDAIERLQRDL